MLPLGCETGDGSARRVHGGRATSHLRVQRRMDKWLTMKTHIPGTG
jgi:hypothetical protein